MLTLLSACQAPSLPEEGSLPLAHPGKKPAQRPVHRLVLRCPEALARQAPSLDALEVWRFKALDTLRITGQFSDSLLSLVYQGRDTLTAWAECLMPDGRSVWIYALCLDVSSLPAQLRQEEDLRRRLLRYAGPSLSRQILDYRRQAAQVQQLGGFKQHYRQGMALRDSLHHLLAYQLGLSKGQTRPDFFWLNSALPGFLVHWIEEEQRYYLWRNFPYWEQLALQTPEPADEHFIRVFYRIYSLDSIEYKLEDWQIDCQQAKPCSYLGRGAMLDMVQALDSLYQQPGDFFAQEIDWLKFRLLKHIQEARFFWLSRPEVLAELDGLMQSQATFWTETDLKLIRQNRAEIALNRQKEYRFNFWDGGI